MMESIAQTCDAHKTVYGLPANRMDALFFVGKLDGVLEETHSRVYIPLHPQYSPFEWLNIDSSNTACTV